MTARLLPLDAATYRASALHSGERQWPETNCYVDLWIEVLHALGFDPRAALGFTVAQDFEGDQFTFFKFPPEDLRALFGLSVQELTLYDTLEAHLATQIGRGRLVLVEVDAFHLPDTRGASYRRDHAKTTIAVNELDTVDRRLGYFHGPGYFALDGEDFDGVLRRTATLRALPDLLFPYAEFVKRDAALATAEALAVTARGLLRVHLARVPADPFGQLASAFESHVATLLSRDMAYFHQYAFNVPRQFGANFELLGDHLAWLRDHGDRGLDAVILDCGRIATGAKTMQFQLARAASRRKPVDQTANLADLAAAHARVLETLRDRYR